jgi:transcriptional regulator with XRE-family HTH domain
MRSLRSKPADVGRARARVLAARFGTELRIARITAGLTQRRLAQRAGVSQQEVSRVERGTVRSTLDTRCRLAAACGHELGWRLYPVASVSLRDSGQLDLAQAIVSLAHPSWKAALEVPIGEADLRAADIVLASPVEIVHIEVERALVDFQAQLRAAQLKRESLAVRLRPGQPVRLVIAVPDTRTARLRLAPYAALIQRSLPMSSGRAWAAIRRGTPLAADAILYVRPRAVTRVRSTSAPRPTQARQRTPDRSETAPGRLRGGVAAGFAR